MRNLHRRFVLCTYLVPVKSTLPIPQNFAAFSEYMNFKVKSGQIIVNLHMLAKLLETCFTSIQDDLLR